MIMMRMRMWRCFFTKTKQPSFAQTYIDRYASLENTVKDQNKKIEELRYKEQLATQAQKMTISDHIGKLFSKITRSKFESKAMAELRDELVNKRQELESLIEQSDKKWEKPREDIKKLRKQKCQDFLKTFITLQQTLHKASTQKSTPQLTQGIILIHRLLTNTLQKHGIQFYSPTIGQEYNPQYHQCIDKNMKGHKISQVLEQGWKINQEVVKKSVVKLL